MLTLGIILIAIPAAWAGAILVAGATRALGWGEE